MKSNVSRIVIPGEVISEDAENYLRGHGTYELKGTLYSSLCGRVEQVNRLITVIPPKNRYQGEIGDVVIGRIISVEGNYWKVDIQSKTNARLNLSSVNFPGSVQRRKTVEDQRKMKQLYDEGDLIVAEVQQILQNDNSCSLQTRSVQYGKVMNGIFVSVNSGLIKRCKQHFHTFSFGVEIILGKNGYIWITLSSSANISSKNRRAFYGTRTEYSKYKMVDLKDRENICRVRNSILVLEKHNLHIYPETVLDVYESSREMKPKEMMQNSSIIVKKAQKRIEITNMDDVLKENRDW